MTNSGVYGQIWRVGFTDILCLMVAFFILIYTVSIPVEQTVEPAKITTGVLGETWQSADMDDAIGNIDTDGRYLDLDYLAAVIQRQLTAQPQGVEIKRGADHLILSLPDELLFSPGRANITNNGQGVLFILADILAGKDNRIEVRGHADPRPVGDQANFANNWTLSLARADQVAGFLTKHGYGQSIIRRGMAAGQYAKLNQNLSWGERMRAARRVDILIYP
jgi:chemotaxis protein MotB